MADNRYKNGVWQGNRISPLQVRHQQANSPVHNGWHYDKEAGRYTLTYCGLTAWLRRPTQEEKAKFSSIAWLVGLVGDDEPQVSYSGWVEEFTNDVKSMLYHAAVGTPLAEDDYGLRRTACNF